MEAIYNQGRAKQLKEASTSINPIANFATRMETASLLVHATCLPFLASIVCSIIGSSTATKPHGLVTKLIHYDSILSPFHNAKASTSDRAIRAVENSIARLAYLKAASESSSSDIRGDVIAGDYGRIFYVNISIGEPAIPQLVMMDTGSSLLWVRCFPCSSPCVSDKRIFDPSKSSTYSPLACNSSYCVPSTGHCDSSKNRCLYEIRYVDAANSRGYYALEKMTFVTPDEGIIEVRNVVFGCAQAIYEPFEQSSGILGLGAKKLSLAIRMDFMFSYCIGNISDPHYTHNQLILGKGAILQGYSTPLEVHKDLYYLSLEGISVGNKRLPMPPMTFQRDQMGNGGVIIDSGATWSYLVRPAFEPLKREVQNLIGGKLELFRYGDHPDWLCYIGIVTRDLIGFPVVTLHFSGGADLELDIENVFHSMEDRKFCMAVDVVDGKVPGVSSVIGVAAQQYLNVGYDLSAGMLYFERIDCELLED